MAARLAAAGGHDVVLGSRDAPGARRGIVGELRERWGDRVATLRAGRPTPTPRPADVVVIATVWDAAVPTAAELPDLLDGKIVVCMANGLEKRGREFHPVLPDEGSIAAAVQAAAPGARVVAALQHVPAAALARPRRRPRRATCSSPATTTRPAASCST